MAFITATPRELSIKTLEQDRHVFISGILVNMKTHRPSKTLANAANTASMLVVLVLLNAICKECMAMRAAKRSHTKHCIRQASDAAPSGKINNKDKELKGQTQWK